MPKQDRFVATVEALAAAGLDQALWPAALAEMTGLFGSVGTTFEVVDRRAGRLLDFWSHGVPTGSELTYADQYISISPRMALGNFQRSGDIGYDYLVIDEAGIDRDPYYSDFMGPADMRYFLSVTVVQTPSELACLAVQRSPRQGHVQREDIELMARLAPHVLQAFDLMRRLRDAAETGHALEDALDWLPEGVLLLRDDATVSYANQAALRYASSADGIRIVRDRLDFGHAATRATFDRALASIRDGGAGDCDFHVTRPSGLPPYLVSMRPVTGDAARLARFPARSMAIVFIRDPAALDGLSIASIAREMYGLTGAEAAVADALRRGLSPAEYSHSRHVSLNTVYTHLRHIKAKTGAKRLPELVSRLNELMVPLLAEKPSGEDDPGPLAN